MNVIPCIAGRRRRTVCGLVIWEAGIGVPHDQSGKIYSSDTYNPLLVEKKICVNYN
jgi:hypothetical protein